ncbi:hypothetical protein ACQPYH_09910 [Kribbella sp. CA-245084]|uniref:hypothetical protein n=1 Tax=Kribbella sp. CA-245084 TaxID=3239940 RepID=UPI003D8A3741
MTDDPLAGWSEPDEELIRRALSRIGDRQHRRVFFERLDNPRWVTALDAHNVFDSPPEMAVDAAGHELWLPWAEGEYLVRMASMVPRAIAQILERISDSDNPNVHDLVVRAALRLPADEARRLASAIGGYLIGGTLHNGEQIVALIESFAAAGLRKPAVRIAQAAFRPRAAETQPQDPPVRRRVVAGIDHYWYGELLGRVVVALDQVLADKVLTVLVAWLEELQDALGEYDPRTGTDSSYVWRPAIGDHAQNHRHHELRDFLVEAVRDRALADVVRGRPVNEVMVVLERSGRPILARIGMHVLAQTTADISATRAEGKRCLMDRRYMAADYRHEYVELARALLPFLDEESSGDWEAMILGGPPLDEDALRDRGNRNIQPGESSEDAARRYSDVWQLNILCAIGQEILPGRAAVRRAELVETYGEPEHPDFPSFMSSWSGPKSPVDQEELSSKSVDEVRQFLTGWTPRQTAPWGDSKEGLSRILQTVVAGRPWEFAEVAIEFADLDPTYVRGFFSGLSDAIKSAAQIDWVPVIRASAVVSRRSDDGTEGAGGMDEDVVWRFAQRAVTSLFESGVSTKGENSIPASLLGEAVAAIAPLADHADPTPEHESQYGGSNMDPLTLSLNTTRPSAIRTIARIAGKARELSVASSAIDMALTISEALDVLDMRLVPDRDESLAVAAAFGESLGLLIWIDPDWAAAHRDKLMTPDGFGDVVLSTALATYSPSLGLIDFVAAAAHDVLERLATGGTMVAGWRTDRSPQEMFGDHLILLLMRDEIAADDARLEHFFATATVATRSSVLGHLGWMLMRSDDVPPEMVVRAQTLWDSRAESLTQSGSSVDELSGFHWWVLSGKFGSAWWLPRLYVASDSDDFDSQGLLGEVLEDTAPKAPRLVADVLERLLSRHHEPFERYDLIEHAPAVIAAALDSGQPETIVVGQRIMDSLGRDGHLRIAELVGQRRLH